MSETIVLVGPPGAGKSTIGRLLADRIEERFTDVDTLIEERGTSIPMLFVTEGEAKFRQLELECTRLALAFGGVVSLGGGAVVTPGVRKLLEGQQVVWLQVTSGEAARRVGIDEHRPLLQGDVENRIAALNQEREQWYSQLATLSVSTDNKAPDSVVAEILAGLGITGPIPAKLVEPPAELPQIVDVATENPYHVQIGHGVINHLEPYLLGVAKVAIIHQAKLSHFALQVSAQVTASGAKPVMIPLPDGESAKSSRVLVQCWRQLAEENFTRSDLVVGLGGGAATDLAGFVAASFLRGIAWVAVPTTVLGMVDAAVGGKTAIDLPEGKNLVGAFHEPKAVLADLDTLEQLPIAEVRSGLGEVVKTGLCADARVLSLIMENPADTLDVHSDRLAELIRRAVSWKATVVADDLREATSIEHVGREGLNYGHTMGHAIEAFQNYRMRHGEAVSIGMVYAAEVARRALGLPDMVVDTHREVLSSLGLPISFSKASFADLRALMARDKKTRGGVLRFVLLRDFGELTVLADPDEALLKDAYAAIA
jgi:3-dehydroquinate synthase/shikimate kinase/3-dehydroquinate synthase